MRLLDDRMSLRTLDNTVQISWRGWWVRATTKRYDWECIQKETVGEWDGKSTPRPKE